MRLLCRARPTQNAPRKHYEVALHVGVVPIAGCPCLPERVEPNKRVCTCCFGIARACSEHKVCVQQGLCSAGAKAQCRKHVPHQGAHMLLPSLRRRCIAVAQ